MRLACAAIATTMCLMMGLTIPVPARADIGIPVLMLIWPTAWLLLPLVIPLKVWFARRVLGLSWRAALRVVLSGTSRPCSSESLDSSRLVRTGPSRTIHISHRPSYAGGRVERARRAVRVV